ncbi:MAG: hypothetical protein ACHBN1_37580 [Heteroscytonema crispum UTEX LB 1556]
MVQPEPKENLTKVGKPIWWYSLQRLANTAILLAAGFSVISGKFQDENWLPKGPNIVRRIIRNCGVRKF